MDFLFFHAEFSASMGDKLIVFNKRASVEKELNSLACRQLVLAVVLVDTGLATTEECLIADCFPTLDESLVGSSVEVHFFSLDQHLV